MVSRCKVHRNIASAVACRRSLGKALCPINCPGTSAAKVSLCGGGASSCSSMSLDQLTTPAAQSAVHEVQGGTLLALPVRSDHDSTLAPFQFFQCASFVAELSESRQPASRRLRCICLCSMPMSTLSTELVLLRSLRSVHTSRNSVKSEHTPPYKRYIYGARMEKSHRGHVDHNS